MRPLALLALLAAAAPALAAQQAKPPAPRNATSTWRATRAPDGSERERVVVNRTFEFGRLQAREEWLDVLYVQEVRTAERAGEEGDNGRVRVEAWVRREGDTTFARRLWSLESAGNAFEHDGDDYLDVREPGCCSSWGATHRFSKRTGREVVGFNLGPFVLQDGAHDDEVGPAPYVVYASSLGAGGVLLGRDALDVGELFLVRGDSVLSHALVSVTDSRFDPDQSAELRVEGAAARILSESTPPIVVPVAGRRFTLAGASVPAGVRVRIVR